MARFRRPKMATPIFMTRRRCRITTLIRFVRHPSLLTPFHDHVRAVGLMVFHSAQCVPSSARCVCQKSLTWTTSDENAVNCGEWSANVSSRQFFVLNITNGRNFGETYTYRRGQNTISVSVWAELYRYQPMERTDHHTTAHHHTAHTRQTWRQCSPRSVFTHCPPYRHCRRVSRLL